MPFMRYLVCEPEASPFAADLAPAAAPGPGLALLARPVATAARQPGGCCTEATLSPSESGCDTEGLLVYVGLFQCFSPF